MNTLEKSVGDRQYWTAKERNSLIRMSFGRGVVRRKKSGDFFWCWNRFDFHFGAAGAGFFVARSPMRRVADGICCSGGEEI